MRVEIPLIIFISLWMPVLGWSQDCDCLDSDNCPLAIEANTTGQVCYDITDALNNNLADPNQGICGVRLTFTHRHIWDLELSLVSPSGQVVPLVGPNTNAFGTTNNVLWDVLFIPCSGNAQPDTIKASNPSGGVAPCFVNQSVKASARACCTVTRCPFCRVSLPQSSCTAKETSGSK